MRLRMLLNGMTSRSRGTLGARGGGGGAAVIAGAGAGGGGGVGVATGVAATDGAAFGAVGAAAASPSDSVITASRAPIGTVSPSATRISTTSPATGEGTSASTLSVDTSSSASSTATRSPTCLHHRKTVPSVTVSPSCGIVMSTACEPTLIPLFRIWKSRVVELARQRYL